MPIDGLDRRAPPAAARPHQRLGLQSRRLHGARSAPRPGGIAELRDTVAALHAAGIGVILDVVFNHTGESDAAARRCRCAASTTRLLPPCADGRLVNDTGTGNTLALRPPPATALVLDALRHFVGQPASTASASISRPSSAARRAASSRTRRCSRRSPQDPLLGDRILSPSPGTSAPAATSSATSRRAGSSGTTATATTSAASGAAMRAAVGDFATGSPARPTSSTRATPPSASVNFIAAHDGFTLADARRLSPQAQPRQRRRQPRRQRSRGRAGSRHRTRSKPRATCSPTLFLSRGTPMLTAGDEFGRTQSGNNNAYAQDNETDTGSTGAKADEDLIDFVASAVGVRRATRTSSPTASSTTATPSGSTPTASRWRRRTGAPCLRPG